jgi:hypothetical protein
MAFAVLDTVAAIAKSLQRTRPRARRLSAGLWIITLILSGLCFAALVAHPMAQQDERNSEAAF